MITIQVLGFDEATSSQHDIVLTDGGFVFTCCWAMVRFMFANIIFNIWPEIIFSRWRLTEAFAECNLFGFI